MRRFAFIAPLAAVMAVAAAAQAQTEPRISVTLGPRVQAEARNLGEREVARQADRLAEVVGRALAESDRYDGAEVRLTLTDLKPNRPTFEQVARTPGLSPIDSRSVGGAEIQVEVVQANGDRTTGRFDYFSRDIEEVRGFSTWQDADRAFARVASRLADGRI